MIKETIIRTPTDYDAKTRSKMIEAGLIRIEHDFEYREDFSSGHFRKTRYVFANCIITCPKRFRKKVYNYD